MMTKKKEGMGEMMMEEEEEEKENYMTMAIRGELRRGLRGEEEEEGEGPYLQKSL